MNTVCPLFFQSAVENIELECRPDRCAWAFEGGCAITVIARSLSSMDVNINGMAMDER